MFSGDMSPKRARSLPSIRRMRPSGSRVNSVTGAEASARCSAEVERFLASLSSGSITMCPFICVVLSAVSQVLAQPRQVLLSQPRSEVSGAPGGPRTVVLCYVYGRTVTMPRRYNPWALVRAVGGDPLRPLSRWTCSCRRSSARQVSSGAADRW